MFEPRALRFLSAAMMAERHGNDQLVGQLVDEAVQAFLGMPQTHFVLSPWDGSRNLSSANDLASELNRSAA